MEDFEKLLIERFQILLSAGFVFFLFLAVAWHHGYFHFSRLSQRSGEKLSSKVILWSFSIFLILQLFIIPLTFEFWYYFYTLGETHKSKISPEIQGWVNIYSILFSGMGMFLYFFSLPKLSQEVVFGTYAFRGWKAKFQDFFIAFMSWILSYPLVVAVGQFVAILLMVTYQNVEPEQVAVKQIKTAATSTTLLTVMVICVIFIVPIIEELLFRGFLQNWLKKFMSQWKSIMVTSFIFAFFHFSPSQGMGNIELLVSLFVLSCFLGFIYERQKSLWAPIGLHALFNAVSIMLIFYADKD